MQNRGYFKEISPVLNRIKQFANGNICRISFSQERINKTKIRNETKGPHCYHKNGNNVNQNQV